MGSAAVALEQALQDINLGKRVVEHPFFLSSKPFTDFGLANYSWDSEERMILIVPNFAEKKTVLPGVSTAEDSNIEIGGCPLECPFDPNEDFDAALGTYTPPGLFKGLDYKDLAGRNITFSKEEANKIRIRIWRTIQAMAPDQFIAPIYIPVDERAMRSDPAFGPDGVLCLFGCVRQYDMCHVKILGPEVNVVENYCMCDVKFAHLLHQKYWEMGAGKMDPTPNWMMDVHAIYEKIHGEFVSYGNVFIEFVWPNPQRIFESPPPNAPVKLAVKPKQGDASPELRKLWEEVVLLERLLKVYETSTWKHLENSTMLEHGKADNISKVQDLSEEFKHLLSLNKPKVKKDDEKESDFSDSLENNLARVVQEERSDFDFNDNLWKLIFSKDGDLAVIYDTLHSIYCEIENKSYRPYVFPRTNTLFSNLADDILNNKVTTFRTKFGPKIALEMAIDCGINKLFKDYGFVLRMCHLLEKNDLEAFGPSHNNLAASLDSVKKLHCLLEVLCLTRGRLGLSMGVLEQHAHKMAQYLLAKEDDGAPGRELDWNKVYHFDIAMPAVSQVMEGLVPIYWNLKVENTDAMNVLRTNVIFSRDLYVSHVADLFTSDEGTLRPGYFIYLHQVKFKKPTGEEVGKK